MKQAKIARKEGKKAREAARQYRGADLDDDDVEEDAEPTGYGDERGRGYGDERGRDYRGEKGDKGGYGSKKKEDGYSWSESKNGKGKFIRLLGCKSFSCSNQLSMKFILLIKVKMPTRQCLHFHPGL